MAVAWEWLVVSSQSELEGLLEAAKRTQLDVVSEIQVNPKDLRALTAHLPNVQALGHCRHCVACPELRELHLSALVLDRRVMKAAPIIRFPKLKHLSLGKTCNLNSTLNTLDYDTFRSLLQILAEKNVMLSLAHFDILQDVADWNTLIDFLRTYGSALLSLTWGSTNPTVHDTHWSIHILDFTPLITNVTFMVEEFYDEYTIAMEHPALSIINIVVPEDAVLCHPPSVQAIVEAVFQHFSLSGKHFPMLEAVTVLELNKESPMKWKQGTGSELEVKGIAVKFLKL
ncbi:hypothetical protein DFP72DRAFT_861401 [Ephemerocybe angulata]|uniref:Uncharacterized protein n=1 Tax=Ephemerocybe angulata TaxID=980116 RepID=A0A8H6LS96_9AGAR|nr:hypothetical protein DFP72DRAFT_861401 [Tulosesus angulatus]